jgi:hypothetical protein
MLVVHGLRVAPSKFKRGLTHGRRGASVSPFSFDAYQYLAFVIPGAVLLLGLMFFFPWIREHVGPTTGAGFDLAGLGAFVIVSFVLGHLLQGLGRDVLQLEVIYGSESAYATNSVFKWEDRILSDRDKTRLLLCIHKNFKVEEKQLMLRRPAHETNLKTLVDWIVGPSRETLETWRGMVRRIYADLRERKQAEPAQRLQRDHALHLELTTAFLLLTICALALLWVQSRRPALAKRLKVVRTPKQLRLLQIGLLAVGTIILYRRTLRFDESFARELYFTFISSDVCKSLVG